MKKNTLLWSLLTIILVSGIIWLISAPTKPGRLDTFATCLAEKGALFYGTFWCPFCQNQKAEFGRSAKLLPYVECSSPDGRSQLSVCTEAGISSYPTWKFADGTEEKGVLSPERLSELTECELPQQ